MKKLIIPFSILIFSACGTGEGQYDASGSFESDTYIISSEVTGTLLEWDLEEGEVLQKGQYVGLVDTIQLYWKKKQLEAQLDALESRKPNINLQLVALREQLKAAQKDQRRISNLVKSDAATPKQLDDINAQIEIIQGQIEAQQSALQISTNSLDKEALPLQYQLEQLLDQLNKCRIINPINGTVLTKYAREHEMTAPGKALYSIADLEYINLRVYITGNQLPLVKLNQEVTVSTDDGHDGFTETKGTITWISDKAEFTPKTIQTKDERANQVYAMKVKVKNDGTYKIGMYGEIKF